MKKYWNAFIMCQSMFCSIPCPWKNWDEGARPYMLLFLPVAGLEIGVIWAALAWVLNYMALPQLPAAAVLCLYPFFITGFIHLDGFMDVTDAVKSWRQLERRREILKDSRVGAFAVISCIALMIMQFAAMASLELEGMNVVGRHGGAGMYAACVSLMFVPVISRCCSSLAVTLLPPMDGSQYEGQERRKAAHAAVYIVIGIAAAAAAFALCGKYGFVTVGVAGGYGIALCRAYKSLEGMNGDISGYSLTIGELCGIVVLALL